MVLLTGTPGVGKTAMATLLAVRVFSIHACKCMGDW
jgi:broad-specificity NMP kinase